MSIVIREATLDDFQTFLDGSLHIIRVDKIEPRLGEHFGAGVAERFLECRIHALEVSVEPADRHHVG